MLILFQVVFFSVCAAFMAAVGLLLMKPVWKTGDASGLMTRLLLSFGAKLVMGVLVLVAALKGFGWTATTSAAGAIAAYFASLAVITAATMKKTQRSGE
ncbi:hypothetical protein GF324_03585 [bacterium]|nr:hypothetical protein [bacterium]